MPDPDVPKFNGADAELGPEGDPGLNPGMGLKSGDDDNVVGPGVVGGGTVIGLFNLEGHAARLQGIEFTDGVTPPLLPDPPLVTI